MEPETPFADLAPLATDLVFDTAAQPRRRGMRRGHDPSRHLLYQAEGLYLDLRLDAEPGGASVVVHGQLADRRDPLQGVAGASVLVLMGGRVVASTQGNRHGEFRLDYLPGEAMRLCLPVAGRGRIELDLDTLLPREGAGDRSR